MPVAGHHQPPPERWRHRRDRRIQDSEVIGGGAAAGGVVATAVPRSFWGLSHHSWRVLRCDHERHAGRGSDGRAGLWHCFNHLWEAVYRHGQRGALSIPLMGSGLARVDSLDRENLLRLILLSFAAYSRLRLICHDLRIVIPARGRRPGGPGQPKSIPADSLALALQRTERATVTGTGNMSATSWLVGFFRHRPP